MILTVCQSTMTSIFPLICHPFVHLPIFFDLSTLIPNTLPLDMVPSMPSPTSLGKAGKAYTTVRQLPPIMDIKNPI